MVSESTFRRIERFKKGIELLREISSISLEKYLEDIKLQSIAERNLQICIEALVDLANVIISKKGLKIPSTYRETMKTIREARIMKNELAKKVDELVGIRNIIAHMYADIKAEIVHENLNGFIKILERSLNALLEFCRRNGIDP